jgi:cytochrome c553
MVLVTLMLTAANETRAEPTGKNVQMKGDATQGKALFNGKGICHYCHGIDGVIDRKPKLEPETQAVAARLAASAPDLRNRAALTLKDNKARFRAIREGHPGSGMFPDTTLSDQDIRDVLAYLATLRQSAPSQGRSPY